MSLSRQNMKTAGVASRKPCATIPLPAAPTPLPPPRSMTPVVDEHLQRTFGPGMRRHEVTSFGPGSGQFGWLCGGKLELEAFNDFKAMAKDAPM